MIRLEKFCEHYNKIIVWGAGAFFENNYKRNFEVAYIVDSNAELYGKEMHGIEIKDPQKILDENVSEIAVLICSSFDMEIYQNARKMGIHCDIYTPNMLFPNPLVDSDYYSEPEFFEDDFLQTKYSVEKNVQILIALMKAHGVRKVVASPGGTNFCFLSSIQRDPYFEIYSSSDERSAAYMACGLAAESGEAVALNCTGATASRNYMPGLTEAYYRKLPVLAITCSQFSGRIGHNCPQVTDRTVLPNDVAQLSVQVPMVTTNQERWSCEATVNKALLELTRHGAGPVHINLITGFSMDCSIKALPAVKVIRRIGSFDKLPMIKKGKIGIFVGAHKKWSPQLLSVVNHFCEKYNAVVLCDQTSNYHGEYRVLAPLILTQQLTKSSIEEFDLLIHMGDITGAYMRLRAKQMWRVNPDGEVRDTFARLRYIFEMEEEEFFLRYSEEKTEFEKSDVPAKQVDEWNALYKKLYDAIPELPFSNMWIAENTANSIPDNSIVYLGILNSLRSWNFFELPEHTTCYANTGGFGIEGGMSSLCGASLADPNKLCFGIFGDLGFFSDINVLGNRHIGNNLRIMVVNNGAGAEFYSKYSMCIQVFGEDLGSYCAAEGHFGAKSTKLIKDFVENLGFEYMSAASKEEYLVKMKHFTDKTANSKSILFEVFTDCESEALARETIQTITLV